MKCKHKTIILIPKDERLQSAQCDKCKQYLTRRVVNGEYVYETRISDEIRRN